MLQRRSAWFYCKFLQRVFDIALRFHEQFCLRATALYQHNWYITTEIPAPLVISGVFAPKYRPFLGESNLESSLFTRRSYRSAHSGVEPQSGTGHDHLQYPSHRDRQIHHQISQCRTRPPRPDFFRGNGIARSAWHHELWSFARSRRDFRPN